MAIQRILAVCLVASVISLSDRLGANVCQAQITTSNAESQGGNKLAIDLKRAKTLVVIKASDGEAVAFKKRKSNDTRAFHELSNEISTCRVEDTRPGEALSPAFVIHFRLLDADDHTLGDFVFFGPYCIAFSDNNTGKAVRLTSDKVYTLFTKALK